MSSPLLVPESLENFQAHRLVTSSRSLLSESDRLQPWVIVLLGLPTVVCLFLCAKAYFGSRDLPPTPSSSTVLVHEGRVFELTEEQRRTALEIIYANSSQSPSTGTSGNVSNLSSRGLVSSDKTTSNIAGDTKTDILSAFVDFERVAELVSHAVKDSNMKPGSDETATSTTAAVDAHSQPTQTLVTDPISNVVDRVKEWINCSEIETAPTGENETAGDTLADYDIAETLHNQEMAQPHQQQNTQSLDDEEAGVEVTSTPEDSISLGWKRHMAKTSKPNPPTVTATGDGELDDDSSYDENICAICLSDYSAQGDLIISSKQCSHQFHKECIFEWLQKHDDCPVCRARMITETDIHRAATFVVGKTRMCRAVASMRNNNHSHTTSSTPNQSTPVRVGQLASTRESAQPISTISFSHGRTIRYL